MMGAAASEHIVRMFSDVPVLVEIASGALVLILLGFPVISVPIASAVFFQAIGQALPALMLFLTRQFIFMIPIIKY